MPDGRSSVPCHTCWCGGPWPLGSVKGLQAVWSGCRHTWVTRYIYRMVLFLCVDSGHREDCIWSAFNSIHPYLHDEDLININMRMIIMINLYFSPIFLYCCGKGADEKEIFKWKWDKITERWRCVMGQCNREHSNKYTHTQGGYIQQGGKGIFGFMFRRDAKLWKTGLPRETERRRARRLKAVTMTRDELLYYGVVTYGNTGKRLLYVLSLSLSSPPF